MARLSRDQIVHSARFPEAEVDVPEWGGSILLRGLSLGERSRLSAEYRQDDGAFKEGYTAALIAATVADPGPFHPDDVAEWPVRIVERLIEPIYRLNNIDEDEEAGVAPADRDEPSTVAEAATARFPAGEQ